jgi:DNA-binding NarL/FixJ family response regulator
LTRLRLIVADDSPPFLQKLVSLLSAEFNIVATAADGKTALNLVRRFEPDLVVLDLQMPGLNGIEVTRELAKNPSSPPVVICSAETDSEIVEAAREAGAAEYVFKARIETELIWAAKSAVRDNPVVEAATNSRFDLIEAVPFAR